MRLIQLFPLFVLLSGCGNGGPPAAEAENLPPDIFLFTMDALRADHLSVYGHKRDTSPWLAEIAERGVVMDRASATTSWTVPSVASMLTGMMPHQLGVTRVQVEEGNAEQRVPSTAITVAERLRAQGYQTYAITSNALLSAARGYDQGFDHFVNVGFEDAVSVAKGVAKYEAEIRDRKKPVFVWVHMFDPHDPYLPQEPWIDKWDRTHKGYKVKTATTPADEKPLRDLTMAALRNRTDLRRGKGGLIHVKALYDSEIRFADGVMADLHKRLDIDDGDLVIFTADHGEEFRDHAALGHHMNLYEETVRVPLIMSWPDKFKPGRRDERVSLMELTPTLAEIAGAPVGPYGGVSSRSLMPLLVDGQRSPGPPVIVDVTRIGGTRLMGIYKGELKVVVHAKEPQRPLLFDLYTDPGETQNRAADMPIVVEGLIEALNDRLEGLPTLEPEYVDGTMPDSVLEELKAMGYIH